MFSLQTMFGNKDRILTLLQSSSEAASEAAEAVNQLTCKREESATCMATFRAARRREKDLAAAISEELVNSFVTVLDREDIEAMNAGLYRIPKTVEKFAARYVLVSGRLGACRTYGIESENSTARGQIFDDSPADSGSIGPEAAEIWTAQADLQPVLHKPDRLLGDVDLSRRTAILVDCTTVVAEMVGEMCNGLRINPMRKLQDRLQALESEADRLLLEPYSDFYITETDPIRAALAKDLYETLEKAIDVCRDVGNVIYSVVLKNS